MLLAFMSIIALGLVVAWIAWGITLFQEKAESQRRLEAFKQEQVQKEEQARRLAAYQYAQEQAKQRQNRTQNAIDALQ